MACEPWQMERKNVIRLQGWEESLGTEILFPPHVTGIIPALVSFVLSHFHHLLFPQNKLPRRDHWIPSRQSNRDLSLNSHSSETNIHHKVIGYESKTGPPSVLFTPKETVKVFSSQPHPPLQNITLYWRLDRLNSLEWSLHKVFSPKLDWKANNYRANNSFLSRFKSKATSPHLFSPFVRKGKRVFESGLCSYMSKDARTHKHAHTKA